jgi:transcriptional regulator with GAF, ATPase, and Fis domain
LIPNVQKSRSGLLRSDGKPNFSTSLYTKPGELEYLLQKPSVAQEFTTLQDYEKNLILKTLEENNWNKHKAAKKA